MRKELPYPDLSGVLTTAGGIVVTAMLDGTIVAFDDQTLDELWKINVGTGFVAPPMTYSVGRQAIHRHRLRHRPGRQGQDRALAGAQVPDQRDDAVRVRAVRSLPLPVCGERS